MITKDMTIDYVLQIKENAEEILASLGMGCVGCPSSREETLENAAMIHGLNLNELLDKLNS